MPDGLQKNKKKNISNQLNSLPSEVMVVQVTREHQQHSLVSIVPTVVWAQPFTINRSIVY